MAVVHIDEQHRSSLQTFYLQTTKYLQQSNANLHAMRYASLAMEAKMAQTISLLQKNCSVVEHKMSSIHTFMLESTSMYHQIEKQMCQQCTNLLNIQNKTISLQERSTSPVSKVSTSPFQTHIVRSDGYIDNIFNLKKALSIFKKNGGIQGKYTLDLLAMTYQQVFGKLSIHADVGLAHAEAKAKAHIAIDKKEFMNSALELDVGASVALAHGVLDMKYNGDWLSGSIQASGDVGVAEATGKASISKKGVHIEGEVGVAATKGKVSGSIKIFGITISANAHGEVGALGVGGVLKAGSNSFEIGAKASCIFGGGFNIKVDW